MEAARWLGTINQEFVVSKYKTEYLSSKKQLPHTSVQFIGERGGCGFNLSLCKVQNIVYTCKDIHT